MVRNNVRKKKERERESVCVWKKERKRGEYKGRRKSENVCK